MARAGRVRQLPLEQQRFRAAPPTICGLAGSSTIQVLPRHPRCLASFPLLAPCRLTVHERQAKNHQSMGREEGLVGRGQDGRWKKGVGKRKEKECNPFSWTDTACAGQTDVSSLDKALEECMKREADCGWKLLDRTAELGRNGGVSAR